MSADVSGKIAPTLTAKQASRILEVSEATVRNWMKHGYLNSIQEGKVVFSSREVISLQKKIESGQIQRLRKRANKRKTENTFIPKEYIEDVSFVEQVEKVRRLVFKYDLPVNVACYILALKQLVLAGEMIPLGKDHFNRANFTSWKRPCVKKMLADWLDELPAIKTHTDKKYNELFHTVTDSSHDDTVGIIYQSLLREGDKSKTGSYYTPISIIDAIFQSQPDKTGKFLDPCCGTGQFLIRAARSGYTDPGQIYGFDLDELAVKIAKVNMFMIFKNREFQPHIENANTISEIANSYSPCETDNLANSFQFVATNPPWGSVLSENDTREYAKLFPEIKSGESFSFFLIKALRFVRKGGRVSFILPESILNIKVHSDIRDYILNHTSIQTIIHLGKCFNGVFTKVIRMDLINTRPAENWILQVVDEKHNKTQIPQSVFLDNENHIFDVTLSRDEREIITRLQSLPHVRLKGRADWALGIVTGDNKKYISDTCRENMEPIYRGSDVAPFRLNSPKSFIHYQPALYQQVAPESLYRAKEKLIYRFISRKLIFAYDTNQSLTLNSANICIPRINNYPVKLVLALLNSKLYQFIFHKMFNTHKILRGDLEQLPLPLVSLKDQKKIIHLVDQAIEGKNVQDKLDRLIMKSIHLPEKMINTIDPLI